MILDNAILWQSSVWMISGYLLATVCNALVGVPKRLVESM